MSIGNSCSGRTCWCACDQRSNKRWLNFDSWRLRSSDWCFNSWQKSRHLKRTCDSFNHVQKESYCWRKQWTHLYKRFRDLSNSTELLGPRKTSLATWLKPARSTICIVSCNELALKRDVKCDWLSKPSSPWPNQWTKKNFLAGVIRCTRWGRSGVLAMCISRWFCAVLLLDFCWSRKISSQCWSVSNSSWLSIRTYWR